MTNFIYDQTTGHLWQDGQRIGRGYSGRGVGLNNPEYQFSRNLGPIPVGVWKLGKAQEHPRLGPLAIALEPMMENQTGGRSGFFIHGDNPKGDNSASQGCIVLPRKVRERIAASSVKGLVVVAS